MLGKCFFVISTRPQGRPTMISDTVLFTGNANPALAQEIATNLGITLGKASVGRFSDGETTVEIQQNVRGRDVFVVQSTCAPTNDNLMELLIMSMRSSALPRSASPPSSPTSVTPARIAARVPPACRFPPRSWPTCCRPWVCTAC